MRHSMLTLLLVLIAGTAVATDMPREHVFSMSFKVTLLNGELANPEVREKAFVWLRKLHIGKVYLESYRHNEYVPTERLIEHRDAFRKAGFEVCGLITYTMLNDPEKEGGERSYVNCWADPKARARTKAEAERAAGIFDTILLDDFMFTNCTCPRCTTLKERGKFADWGAYRRRLITNVLTKLIREPARAVNPKVEVIVKYPCWYKDWMEKGYDPAAQSALVDGCWIGTETRNTNPDALQACWINDFIQKLSKGRCRGAWYDPLDCTPQKFIEQARYTILGGARESIIHCWDYLKAENPGPVPFGESAKGGHECCAALEKEMDRLVELAERLSGAERGPYWMDANGVSTHYFYNHGMTTIVTVNTKTGKMDALVQPARQEPPGDPGFVLPSLPGL